jgi:hypothetical protein
MSKITLIRPILRSGGQTVTEVGVRQPDVGSLRGLKMTDILQMDVNAMLALLPRITEPALLPSEVAGLAPADFMSLSGKVVGFFLSPDQQAQLEAMERPN